MRRFRSLALSCAVAVSASTACGSGKATEPSDQASAAASTTTKQLTTRGNQSDEVAITLKGTSAASSSNS